MEYKSSKSNLFENFLRENMLESDLSVNLVVELERRARMAVKVYELTGDVEVKDILPIVQTVRKLEALYADKE